MQLLGINRLNLVFIFVCLSFSNFIFCLNRVWATSENKQSQKQLNFQPISPITNVDQLQDVSPDDWAYEALKSLSERYGCITGFEDNKYRGNRALTRYEFAASLNTCLNKINTLIPQNTISNQDFETVQKLSEDFAAELATIRGRIDKLENRVSSLQNNQFSTTSKLKGQVVFALNVGGFSANRIIDPNGDIITQNQPQATSLYRASIDLDTSFKGTDNLKIRLDTGSNGFDDNAAGILEPNFGSILNYSDSPPRSGNIGIGRAYYRFKPEDSLQVAIGPLMVATDYIDQNRYTLPSFRNLSTESLAHNYILFPIEGPSGGAFLAWNKDKFTIRATYNAADADNPDEVSGIVPGLSTFTTLLYPNGGGSGGLFGDFYQGAVELEYSPSKALALQLQYSGGKVFDSRFDVFGVNAQWQFSPKLAVFGRYGYGSYDETVFGNIKPSYWMGGLSFIDLFRKGAILGIAAGQPFIVNEIGNATQTNFEAFYNFPVNDNIAIAPILQVIVNPSNQNSNDTVITGTIRTVVNF